MKCERVASRGSKVEGRESRVESREKGVAWGDDVLRAGRMDALRLGKGCVGQARRKVVSLVFVRRVESDAMRYKVTWLTLTIAILAVQQCCLGNMGPAGAGSEAKTHEPEGKGARAASLQQGAVNPKLKYATLASYEQAIGEKGVFLDANDVCLYAPERWAKESQIVFGYLVAAYQELHKLVGTHTDYKIVVYHFPEGHPDARGGTSNCTIWYGFKNLELENQQEWRKHRVPHLAGYIEEMAHNFVSATHAQFGWEMIGWSIGTKVTEHVAGNPIFFEHIKATRAAQKKTFARYRREGHVFPADLPANLCDRIHAWMLYECEKQYGPGFWRDFFKEVAKEQRSLREAVRLRKGHIIRNRRYQITVGCFDRLKGLRFKERLQALEISLDVDIKSLHPMELGWDRRFVPGESVHDPNDIGGQQSGATEPAPVDAELLSPLHLAAYRGEMAKVKSLIGGGTTLESKDDNDRTALHLAAMGGHMGLVSGLLEMGADRNTKDKQGYTAADLAEHCGHSGTARILRQGN